jgi:hypothetical protein
VLSTYSVVANDSKWRHVSHEVLITTACRWHNITSIDASESRYARQRRPLKTIFGETNAHSPERPGWTRSSW